LSSPDISEIRRHPSSPYGLRRDKEDRGQTTEDGGQKAEDIRLRPMGYAATRRSEIKGHPSSPYGLRRDKEVGDQRAEFRIADFKKSRKQRFSCGSGF